jgi:dienelactone hydrolase
MGFCMGGALTIAAAAHIPALSAAVCFYGVPPAAIADPKTIRVPLQCHFAEQDTWCTPAVVAALEQQLREANVPHELHRYDAQHAFFNETAPRSTTPPPPPSPGSAPSTSSPVTSRDDLRAARVPRSPGGAPSPSSVVTRVTTQRHSPDQYSVCGSTSTTAWS